jgi:hypothetical protein
MDAVRSATLSAALMLLMTEQAEAQPQAQWSVDLLIGDAYNFDSRTHIAHGTLGELSFDGNYETRGLKGPLHYVLRVSRWRDDRAWEVQLLHHKLYLENRPAGADALSVSHGFNIVTLNRAFELNRSVVRIGLGPVVAHPEARIDGVSYDGPYELAGAAGLLGIALPIVLSHHWSLAVEASATFGYVDVHPTGSPELEFSIRNPAVHAQVGVGYRF